MASTRPLPPVYTLQSKHPRSPEKTLRRYRSTFIFAFFFLSLLIVPWVFLSLLNVRPIGNKRYASSWQDLSGSIGDDAVQTSEQLYRAAIALNAVAAVLTLPVLSILLNHAAVVFVQRRHPDQHLNAFQMLALADAPWSRLPSRLNTGVLWSSYGAMALVALGFLQLILQSALVTSEEVQVATSLDAPAAKDYPSDYYRKSRYAIIGYDPTPKTIAKVPVPLVTKELAARLSTESSRAIQPRLWHDGLAEFVTAFPSSIDTGVLRYHTMRFNTSVQCDAVSRDRFPETCPGSNPFYGNLSLPSMDDDPTAGTPNILIRWCIPGDIKSSPWLLNRDRQDIAESFFLDVFLPEGSWSEIFAESFTTQCLAHTTRGYFELPNYHNKLTTGPLLENWTIAQGQSTTTNDEPEDDTSGYVGDYIRWVYSSNYPYSNHDQVAPGPLTTTMISMLGNESWIVPLQNISETSDQSTLKTIYRAMCTGGIPLLSWESGYGFSNYEGTCTLDGIGYKGTLRDINFQTHAWFDYFSHTSRVSMTLTSATFFANEATLTRAGAFPGWHLAPGVIYTSAGTTVHKPNISLPSQILISVLIGIEALVILILLAFIYRKPTFTNRLDALIVATIGAQLSAEGIELPHLDETGEKRQKLLKGHDGVIGFNYGGLTDEEIRDSSNQGATHGQAEVNSDNDIELSNIDEPRPAKILIVGGIGSL